MTRVCDGSELPRADKNKIYLLRARGTSSHEMWDVTDPAKPSRLNVIESGLRDTQELVGVRQWYRTPRFRRDRLARETHGADLRPE